MESVDVHDDFPANQSSSPDYDVESSQPPIDLLKIAFQSESTYQLEGAKRRTKRANPYTTDIKTGQTDGVRKAYDPKNSEEILIILCPKCSKSNPKNSPQAELQKPVLKIGVGQVDISVEATSDDKKLIVTYSLISTGEVFQRKVMSAKKLRKNLADIVFGRPASPTLQLVIKNGSFGSVKLEEFDRPTLDLQLLYLLAFL